MYINRIIFKKKNFFLEITLQNKIPCYNIDVKYLQGRVKFPTGGYSPRAERLNWWNSNTDSIVWMVEEITNISNFYRSYASEDFRGFFIL